jgi:hypothetical protein
MRDTPLDDKAKGVQERQFLRLWLARYERGMKNGAATIIIEYSG